MLVLERNGSTLTFSENLTWCAVTQFGHKKFEHVRHLATAVDSLVLQLVQVFE